MIGKKQIPNSLLGIAFEATRAHFAHVQRAGDSFEVQKAFSLDLSASPIAADAVTLGGEIRQALQQYGIKENRCVVALPVRWVLSLATKLPELAEADVPEFLNVEAERNFAYDPESLFVSSSRCRVPSGEQYANIAGVQRDHILTLQNVLQAARLKPLSITIGIAAIQRMFAQIADPILLLSLGTNELEVGITCGDGLFAMRSLENAAVQSKGEAPTLEPDAIGRELRVTLGQIPAEIRGRMIQSRVFAPAESAARLRTELSPRLSSMGIAAELTQIPGTDASPSAVAAAAGYLLAKRSDFDFLPPKVSAWKQFAGTTSARKVGWAAGIAAAVVLLLLAAFLLQSYQLSHLQSRWDVMAPRVTQLDEMQGQIKKFRPWFDASFRNMTILQRLTEAFPVDGSVTAKTLDIRNDSLVSCTGVAKDDQAYFKMIDQLRGFKEIADVKYDQIHGKSPLQFTFNFRWVEGGNGEH